MLTLPLAFVLGLAPALSPLAAATAPGSSGDWTAFRGSDGTGIAAGSHLPAAIGPDDNLLWRIELPAGYSSPIVEGGYVYLTAAEGTELITLCLDGETGAEDWSSQVEFDGARVGANSSAAPTPATDGERVYSLFHAVGMVAYDLNGEQVWHNDLGSPYNIPHGLGTSPVVHDGRVVVQLDQDNDSHIVCLEGATGEVLWDVARPGVTHGYSTPIFHTPEEGPTQVITSGAQRVVAYSLDTGEELWWVTGSAWQVKAMPVLHGDLVIVSAYMVPSSEFGAPPITQTWEEALAEKDADGDGLIGQDEWDLGALQSAWFVFDLDDDKKFDQRDYEYLVSAGRANGGLFAVRLGGEGDVTDTHVAWRYGERKGLSDVITPLVLGDTLYLLKEGGILTALDVATGEVSKQGRIGGSDRYFASPVGAGDRLLAASLSGQLIVVEGGPEWEVLSTADIEEQVWSTPAIAGERVFVRSQQALYCFSSGEQDG
jgi:hypothetical protein